MPKLVSIFIHPLEFVNYKQIETALLIWFYEAKISVASAKMFVESSKLSFIFLIAQETGFQMRLSFRMNDGYFVGLKKLS